MTRLLFILFLIKSFSQATVKPVIGILPFQVPSQLEPELSPKKQYISASASKWLEMSHTRWIPIDPSSPTFRVTLNSINGILIMGELDEFDRSDLITNYKNQISLILEMAKEFQKQEVYFPIISLGFGAKLVFEILAEKSDLFLDLPLGNTLLDFEFTSEDSSFKKITINPESIFKGSYPYLGKKYIHLDVFEKYPELKDQFYVIAKAVVSQTPKKEALGFYECKTLPVFGLLSDYQTVHFTSALIDSGDITEAQLDIGFELTNFWAALLKKNPLTADEKFVLGQKKGWMYFSSKTNPQQFEEIYVKDL